ncbi:helix-turn-helix domain-containing protein [Mesobacillus maritimus]|uniref:helix-turn-helix domain-containing protein n=1 Tax=Mesobacillus maritimus TaxID=1643336 RepID=UPI0020415D7F|nr:helix-turn-helix domain-containing protein [Mesobacillus maritimus]MCM3669401.1 helix-turn-helix domain-containing protein [Mesobacillus maritimus]
MKESKADLILHPVRMRIVQTLINGKTLTAQEIGERLKDIPQATLYRQLNKLTEGNVLEVVAENPIRETVEKVYSLAEQSATLSETDVESWSKNEHREYFMKFISTVIADFEKYLTQPKFDMKKDGTGYRQVSFYASDEEYLEFLQTLQQGIQKLLENDVTPTRRKRTLSTIVTSENNKSSL